jgi:hypothetical protein
VWYGGTCDPLSASDDLGIPEEKVMAHREQHRNRESKKPKKDKPKEAGPTQSSKWAVSEIVERRPDASKH